MRTLLSVEEFKKRFKELLPLKEGFDLIDEHVVIVDENANILYANKAVENNTGFPLSEVIGKNPADLWGGNMPKEFYEKMWHTIKEEKKPFVGEVQNKRKDGTLYWQEIHVSPVLNEQGDVKFFIGIEPNITDRKKRDQFREEFISAVSHQLRNPLVAIRWVLESLLSGNSLEAKNRKKLEIIYKEGLTLSDLVRDLLLLARVDKGSLQSEEVALDKELDESIGTVRQKHPAVSFSFQNEAGTVVLTTIKSLALQVFLNIIHNAAEHTDKEHGEVKIKLQRTEEGVVFSSYNNGPPIPENFRSLIFSKVPSSTGAGLGLFIAKMICEHLGWKISFETGETGTTFFVVIPL